MDTFSISNATRGNTPRVVFSDIKDAIMGKKYSLSLAFVGDTRMRSLNKTTRKKDATTDILSFEISKDSGEIVISPKEAAKRSKHFGLSPADYTKFLFIHGLLHLKGYDHGEEMETLEKKWCIRFKIPLSHTHD